MSTILSPRVDAVSKLQPISCPPAIDDTLARADGLTVDEALELATWLTDAGNDSIEVIHEAGQSCVVWHR